MGRMALADRAAMALAGGLDSPIAIIPAAAAPENNHERAGENGVRWFGNLGATRVETVPLTDRRTADDAEVATVLARSKFIYLLGGFPGYLAQSLQNSLSWRAILTAFEAGAVVGGSSAGAMVLCEFFYDPAEKAVVSGLNLIGGICVLPHHNRFGSGWGTAVRKKIPGTTPVGIDEETACIGGREDPSWRVHGKGAVTLYLDGSLQRHGPGMPFKMPISFSPPPVPRSFF